jgi:heme A synthase
MTHRILAFLVFFHVLGLLIAFTRRREAPIVLRTVRVAFGLILLQILVAGAMIGMHMPPELRSLHQAVGVGIWLSLFTLAYLARFAARQGDDELVPASGPSLVGRATIPAVASNHGARP